MWSQVEYGFDSANETINFGVRILAEDDSLYETSTLAVISTEHQVTKNPTVQCLNKNNKLFLSIDNTFRIFSNNCSALNLYASFECDINSFSVSSDDNFVILCLCDGNIHCLHVPSSGKLIFSTVISEVATETRFSIFSTIDNESISFIICTIESIYRLTINNTQDIFNNLNDSKDDLNVNFTFDKLNIDVNPQLTCIKYDENLFHVSQQKCFADCGNFLIALNEEGNIIAICKLTKSIFNIYNKETVQDLIVFKSSNSTSHQLLISSHKNSETHIKLLTYPNFETIYNLISSTQTYFVASNSEEDEVMFIEGFQSENSEFINELRLKLITESSPEVKLQRLLRRRSFKEAKHFASLFKLNLQPIFQAEAEDFIITSNFQISDIEKFLEILNNVDVCFITENCLNTADSLTGTEKLLEYADRRIQVVLQNNPDDETFLKLKNRILKMFIQLQTFKILHSQEFIDSEQIINKWIHFSNVDLCEEMFNYLKNGKIDKCSLVFNRLQHLNVLDVEIIENILKLIPDQCSLMDLLPLLRHLLIFSIHYLEESLPVIINWIYSTVLSLELSRTDWLEFLLNFTTKIQSFLFTNKFEPIFQKNFAENGCLNKFKNLVNVLVELTVLKRDFGIKLSISNYIQSPHNVVQILLNKITLNQIKNFMEKIIFTFCEHRKMNVDKVLSHYIKYLSKSQKLFWDERVISLIPFIKSNTLRMETVLIVLQSADVPWNNKIEQLATQSEEECHPLTLTIKNIKDNIPWKMLLKKFSIVEQQTFTNDEIILITRKILLISNSDVLNDLEIILEKYPHLKERCILLCVNNFIQNRKIQQALDYLNNLSENIIKICFKSVLMSAQNYMFSKIPFNDFVINYIEILNSMLYRVEKIVPEYEFQIYSYEVRKLKNIFILKNKYGCDEINDLHFDFTKLLTKLIQKILTSVNEKAIDWFEAAKKCEELSHITGISKEECFFEFAKQNGNLQGLIILAEKLLKLESNALNMCTMAVFLIKNIDNNEMLENIPNLQKNHNVMKALELINKLTVKSCLKADDRELLTTCEILNLNNICFWFKNNSANVLPQWKYSPLFQPKIMCSLSSQTALIIKDLFEMFLKISAAEIMLPNYLKEKKMEKDELEEYVLKKLDLLPKALRQLHTEGNGLTEYQILNVIKIKLMSIESNEDFLVKSTQKINPLLNNPCIIQLLNKIINSNKFDYQFAFVLFLSSDFQPLKWIKSVHERHKMKPDKLHVLTNLICNYIEFRKMPTNSYESFLSLKIRCDWWQKLLQYCLPHYDAFVLRPDDIIKNCLIKSDKLTVKLLQNFCADFELNVQHFLPLYLRNFLLQWKPNLDDNKAEEKKLFDNCKEIISVIENKAVTVEILNSVWGEVSYYRHEIYLCILGLFETLNSNCVNADKRFLLLFLQNYTRISKPQQKELDDWQTKYQFARDIDPLSEFRLPYLLEMYTKDVWEIIRPEINLMTYEKWLKNAFILQLQTDHICIYAIKGTINSGILKSKDSTWCVTSKHDTLLQTMETCVSKMENLKFATAVLYQAIGKVSGGADQVSIAKMCWKKAKQWKKSIFDESNDQVNYYEIKNKYFHCLTKHILHCHNVGTEKYLSLIENSDILIRELYQDESIVQRTKGTVVFYPDINKVVDELGTQLGIDIIQKRTVLIMEFLQKSCKSINFDETICFSPKIANSLAEDDDNISDNLKRVVYICESSPKETWEKLLLNICFAKMDETISEFAMSPDLSMKVQALQCLLIITEDLQELEEYINESPNSHLQKLQILTALETVGFTLTVYELDNCNKIDLTWKILQRYSSNSILVRSLANLCAVYEILDTFLWNKILQCFIDLSLIVDLQKWLPKLYIHCYTPSTNCPFINGWNLIIKHYFLKVLNDEKNIIQGFLLLQMCPIISKLESTFLEIFEVYMEINVLEVCAMISCYVENGLKKRFLTALESKKCPQLFEKLDNFAQEGIINTDHVINVLKFQNSI